MPELPRSEAGRAYVSHHYEDIGEMLADRLDGLIVTGTEPRAPELSDEPYWPTMTKIVDWAEDHTISTVWSCLAAHAAVLHSDGIQSPAFSRKAFGRIRVREGRGPRDRGRALLRDGVCRILDITICREEISLRTTFAFCRGRLRQAPICSSDSGRVFRFICRAIRNMTPPRCFANIGRDIRAFVAARNRSIP